MIVKNACQELRLTSSPSIVRFSQWTPIVLTSTSHRKVIPSSPVEQTQTSDVGFGRLRPRSAAVSPGASRLPAPLASAQ